MAMMMARLYTGYYDIVALRNAYHGLSAATMGAAGLHTWKHGIAQVILLDSISISISICVCVCMGVRACVRACVYICVCVYR